MKGSNKKQKIPPNLDLFENTKKCDHSATRHGSSELTDKQSNVICFKTASTKVKSASNVSLEEKALKSILNRANKLKW
ncbi:MAG: hypothetical protein A2Y97_08365 [Nitrospirae bacterium RBG_13_39_12]|nr:MAG: hypothetical protein A2Y97_08365 [Nitrospirae bacterium RBG_13_39_12]